MRFAGIIKNDLAAAPGVCVTFFTQGCPHHCQGCHNPETWDFNGGKEFTNKNLIELFEAINANGVQRDLCIMGGEPLCQENEFLTNLIIDQVKETFPGIKIYVWSGYTYAELKNNPSSRIKNILQNADYLIDGPYVQKERDVTLPMRGSCNQNIINLKLDKIENF